MGEPLVVERPSHGSPRLAAALMLLALLGAADGVAAQPSEDEDRSDSEAFTGEPSAPPSTLPKRRQNPLNPAHEAREARPPEEALPPLPARPPDPPAPSSGEAETD